MDKERAWEAYLEAKAKYEAIRQEARDRADEDYRKSMRPFSDAYFRPDPEQGGTI